MNTTENNRRLRASMLLAAVGAVGMVPMIREKSRHSPPGQGKKSRLRPMPGNKIAIGRNDPCHCGSGKKFKKCCSDQHVNSQIVKEAHKPAEQS